LEADNGAAPGFPPTRAPSGLTLFRSWWSFVEDLPEGGWCAARRHGGRELGTRCLRVEFADDNGKTYAMVALKAEQLMRLHHEPVHQAA
jgi:hypothetical protein